MEGRTRQIPVTVTSFSVDLSRLGRVLYWELRVVSSAIAPTVVAVYSPCVHDQ